MRIIHFKIHKYRNLEFCEVKPSLQWNAFWGSNGMGKTNILEALYVCLRGKSFRHYSDHQSWLPNQSGEPHIELILEDDRGYQNTVQLTYRDKQWRHFINGKACTLSKIRPLTSIVVFTPDDHELLRGAPEKRRQFLDELYIDVCPGYAEVLHRFEKVLKNRNQLLKRLKEHPEQEIELAEELALWDHMFSRESVELILLRAELWPEFSRRFVETVQLLNPQLAKRINLRFEEKIKCQLDLDRKSQENEFLKALIGSRVVDVVLGYTRLGPHRDTFEILLDGQNAKAQSSQGQARLLALALKWTQTLWVKSAYSENPLFFIDDLSSELDAERRGLLLEAIRQLDGQVFITGTDPQIVDQKGSMDYSNYLVKSGNLALYKRGVETNGGEREIEYSI